MTERRRFAVMGLGHFDCNPAAAKKEVDAVGRKPAWAGWFGWLAMGLVTAAVWSMPAASLGQEPAEAVQAEDLVLTRPPADEELGPFPDDPTLALDYLLCKRYYEPKKHEGKVVYLTVDDGPSHKTQEYLNVLESKGVRATFFLLGKQVARYPEMTRAIRDQGHKLANHTYTHLYKTVYQSVDTFMEEVEKTRAVILETAGVDVRLVRAPGGVFDHFEKEHYRRLEAAGYVNHDWNLDSQDSVMKKVTAEKIMRHVRADSKGQQVIVLLIHDSGKKVSLEALPQIIDYYLEEGYTFDVLPEYEAVAVHKIPPLREIKKRVEAALLAASRDAAAE
jgi:peptidoglycan/xylan/chitin deacetylase (PgdA/CDA1 family)